MSACNHLLKAIRVATPRTRRLATYSTGTDGGNRTEDLTAKRKRQRQQQQSGLSVDPPRNDDRFQYDFKEPLLDAGMANMYKIDESTITIAENLPTGFRLSSGKKAYGPLLIVNNEAFTLNIPPPEKGSDGSITNPLQSLDPRALEVLSLVDPKPEMLVVGGGARLSMLSPAARKYLISIGVNVELASTRHASSTFNTLMEEGRNIALLALPSALSA